MRLYDLESYGCRPSESLWSLTVKAHIWAETIPLAEPILPLYHLSINIDAAIAQYTGILWDDPDDW